MMVSLIFIHFLFLRIVNCFRLIFVKLALIVNDMQYCLKYHLFKFIMHLWQVIYRIDMGSTVDEGRYQ